jgi:hypothetical protein
VKVITVVSDRNNDGFRQLERSLKYYGYDLDVLLHPFEFGGQMKHVYHWCKNNWGLFLYTDGWDTFALGPASELMEKFNRMDCDMLISAEKNCYPLRETASLYPECDSQWRYVNGGGFMGKCETFAEMFEDGTHATVFEKNDQQWLAEQYCRRHKDGRVKLDTGCEIFQTIAFEGPNDFGREVSEIPEYDNHWKDQVRLVNKHTGSKPIFIHGNGHTPMDKIYKLL